MNPWDLIVMQPMINVLIVLSHYLFSSFGLTIIVLTIIIRGLMYPLTVKQLRATKAMQALQPKLAELQKKHAKDKSKLAQEQMRLYKESGVSPAGCLVPMLVQMPIWIALYWSIIKVLAVSPEAFLDLSRFLYSWPILYSVLPLNNHFLRMELSSPNFVLALLVGGSMWVQQKMVTPGSADPKQQAQSRMMLWMMPMLFFFFSLQFPSGLALYWVVSNVISIVMQYFVTGWGALLPAKGTKQVTRDKKLRKRIAQVEEAPVGEVLEADIVASDLPQESEQDYGGVGDKRQDRGAGYPRSTRQIRRHPRPGRRHRPKRR
jgi:YidC/Oxa1 family membrane protein insertase